MYYVQSITPNGGVDAVLYATWQLIVINKFSNKYILAPVKYKAITWIEQEEQNN